MFLVLRTRFATSYAKSLNRASLHRLFRCTPTTWLPARSPRAAPMYRVLRPRFAASLMPSCSTGFASPYKHTWCVLAAVFALTRLEGFASPYKHFRDEFIGAERAEMTSYKSEQTVHQKSTQKKRTTKINKNALTDKHSRLFFQSARYWL
jgi:hypothetical protein